MIIGVNKNLLNALFTQKHYFNRHLLTQDTIRHYRFAWVTFDNSKRMCIYCFDLRFWNVFALKWFAEVIRDVRWNSLDTNRPVDKQGKFIFCKARVKCLALLSRAWLTFRSSSSLVNTHTDSPVFLRIPCLQSARNNFWRLSRGGQVMLRARLNPL